MSNIMLTDEQQWFIDKILEFLSEEDEMILYGKAGTGKAYPEESNENEQSTLTTK
jgi:hypothetical protein